LAAGVKCGDFLSKAVATGMLLSDGLFLPFFWLTVAIVNIVFKNSQFDDAARICPAVDCLQTCGQAAWLLHQKTVAANLDRFYSRLIPDRKHHARN
jgi:hypothetical protein